MSFGLLPLPAVLLGIVALAAILLALQWLRVQHREVEVQTTLFWQVALEETRARVFTKRFRHWPAWLLLVAIASLLWMLFGQPRMNANDATQHIVLLDWNKDDAKVRESDLDAAVRVAANLPIASRQVVAVSDQLETLLTANEPTNLIRLRSEDMPAPSADGIEWALEAIAAQASSAQPVAVHVVGDTPVDAERLAKLTTDSGFEVFRVASGGSGEGKSVRLQTFGVSEAMDGVFEHADVWLQFAGSKESAPTADRVAITSGGEPISTPLIVDDEGRMELRGLDANGATLSVAVDGGEVGKLTLPKRLRNRVLISGDVPAVVSELIALDPACEVVSTNADVIVGTNADADFRFQASAEDQAAFVITFDEDSSASSVMQQIVDELALRQIDATGLAEQTGRVVRLDVQNADKRSVAVWSDLFSPGFNFRESRSCPVFVSRAIRWLANKPPIVEWVAAGERLPASATAFTRVGTESTISSNGKELAATRLVSEETEVASVAESNAAGIGSGTNLFAVLGLLVIVLLTGEWVLYQRGQMP